jgi:UDP-glucose 6-dehydrogenase
MQVKIIGHGWVGKAMESLFPDAIIEVHTKKPKADVAFICVPTPLKNGKLDTSIVEEVIKNCEEDLIVVRSTVMPGTCDKLGKNICFMPEYLGETVAHPLLDETQRRFLIIGGTPENRRKVIELMQTVYNANITIRQVSNYEAEVIKLSENRAIAFKVAQCQELYDVCEKANIDYYTIRDAVYGDDPRFNLWWTFIYPDKRGFNSKCIPKDVYGWAAWAESLGYTPDITKSILERNEKWIYQS